MINHSSLSQPPLRRNVSPCKSGNATILYLADVKSRLRTFTVPIPYNTLTCAATAGLFGVLIPRGGSKLICSPSEARFMTFGAHIGRFHGGFRLCHLTR